MEEEVRPRGQAPLARRRLPRRRLGPCRDSMVRPPCITHVIFMHVHDIIRMLYCARLSKNMNIHAATHAWSCYHSHACLSCQVYLARARLWWKVRAPCSHAHCHCSHNMTMHAAARAHVFIRLFVDLARMGRRHGVHQRRPEVCSASQVARCASPALSMSVVIMCMPFLIVRMSILICDHVIVIVCQAN